MPAAKKSTPKKKPAPIKEPVTVSEPPVQYDVVVDTALLNVREKPSMSSAIVGAARFGETHTIIEEKDGWGKRKSGGWIALKFTRKS